MSLFFTTLSINFDFLTKQGSDVINIILILNSPKYIDGYNTVDLNNQTFWSMIH